MTENIEISASKQRGGFKKGVSGNPAGKPKGARHRATIMVEQMMEGDADSIVRAVIGAAQGGDMVAARLVLERIAPVRKGRLVSLPLPSIENVAGVMAALNVVVENMAGGELTPDEASVIAGVLEVKRRAIESEEFETRLRALEERTNTNVTRN